MFEKPVIQNERLRPFIKDVYELRDLERLETFLQQSGSLIFPSLGNGLFGAAAVTEVGGDISEYHHVWIRDNIHVAHALLRAGRVDQAIACARGLEMYLSSSAQVNRVKNILSRPELAADPSNRPHIRFNGATMMDNPETWSHAQNDALGYFVWFFSHLALEGHMIPSRRDLGLLTMLCLYFEAVQYWCDRDSGHWEEYLKVNNSSIGVVVAGLRRFSQLLEHLQKTVFVFGDLRISCDHLEVLAQKGLQQLKRFLPWETRVPEHLARRADGALLFLIYPLDILTQDQANQVVGDIESQLLGRYGIKRYLGDSYWCQDYKRHTSPRKRTANLAHERIGSRDRLLEPGKEAQWCIFDSIMSIYYGIRFHKNGLEKDLNRQVWYFNRSLGQLTSDDYFGGMKFPESYYVEDTGNGRYVPNDVTPLLWTQANFICALLEMRQSAVNL